MKMKCPQTVSNKIQLSTSATPGYVHTEILTQESAGRACELLTINHTLYHTRFNEGFHNIWEYNKPYQAPIEKDIGAVRKDLNLKDPTIFDSSLGNDDCYANFLQFFEDEIAQKGTQGVIREYVLKGDERANDIFCRMYTDVVHPMIHLGYTQALTAAYVHHNWPRGFLLPAEGHIRSNVGMPSRSLLHIMDSVYHDPEIASAVKDSDPFNKIRDGLLKRVTPKQLVPYLSQFPMSEMMHTCAYMMGAAQRPGKHEAIDFVLLHSVTLAVFYPAILAQDWLSDHENSCLLEPKARVNAVIYAGCGSPALYPARIVDYVPRCPGNGWPELFHRSIIYHDEGHVAKLIRALFSLEQVSEPVSEFPIVKGDFVKIAYMALDSVERALQTNGHKMPEYVAEAVIKKVGQGGELVVNNIKRWVFYDGLNKA
ncbi:hypothetical protein BDR22DRAFT_882871 [Usnea florida]